MEGLKSAAINQLREFFDLMVTSRRRLRPILSDIAAAIDREYFIDADSEEVHSLLKQILRVQEALSYVEPLKKAVNSKKLELIDKGLIGLEQSSRREEYTRILATIDTLVVESDNPAIIDAVRKVKLQAMHIRNKSNKMDAAHFEQMAERYVMLARIIEKADEFSPHEYLKIANNFQDNPLIAMILTSHLIHFPKPVEESDVPERSEERKELPPIVVEELVTESAFEPNRRRQHAVELKFSKVKPNLELVSVDEANFDIEKANPKKLLNIKAFINKVRSLTSPLDPTPIFKMLLSTRIFFNDDMQDLVAVGKLTRKIVKFAPVLLDRLFTWGLADKITWRGRQFYFLNAYGFGLCIRAFPSRNAPLPPTTEDYFADLTNSVQLAIMLMCESRIKDQFPRMEFAYVSTIPAARAEIYVRGGERQTVLIFSLTLLGDKWIYSIAKFKILIETEIDSGNDLKAVFLFAFSKEDLDWLKMFDTVKFKKLKFFMMTLDGMFDREENAVAIEDWVKICEFGVPTHRKGAETSQPTLASRLKETGDDKPKGRKPLFDNPPPDSDSTADEVADTATDISESEEDTTPPLEIPDAPDESDAVVESETAVEPPQEIPVTAPPETEPVVETATPIEDKVADTDTDIVKADLLSGITNLFKADKSGRAMLALHALKDYFAQVDDGDDWADYLTKEIGFILDDPLTIHNLHNFDTFEFWTGNVEISKANIGNSFDYLNLAATIKNFYAPLNPTNFQLQKIWKQLNNDKSNAALKSCPAAKNLISLFNIFTEKTHRAFADCLNASGDNSEDNFKAALAQVKNVENIADSLLHADVNHRRVKDLIQQLFNNNGLVRKYLAIDNYSPREIFDFCREYESTNLNVIISESGATINEDLFDAEKIDALLDKVWANPVVRLVRREHEPFTGPKRKKVMVVMKQLLTALLNYVYTKRRLEFAEKSDRQSAPVDKALDYIADLRKQILKMDKKFNLGQVVFSTFVDNLAKKINGENVTLSYSECLLGANYIELEDDVPVIDSFGVAEFSLKNRTSAFESEIKYKKPDDILRTAYDTALRSYDCGILRDLVRYYLPQLGISEEDVKRKLNGLERQVDKQIDRIYNDFLNDLELARNYSRITDQEKIDFYINAVVDAKEHFTGTKNAGLFRRFVNACTTSINKASIPQRNALNARLEKLEDNLQKTLADGETLDMRYPILTNIHRQINLMNLTVAEDYMNRLETEGSTLLTELDVIDSNLKTLEDFLADYETLYRAIANSGGSVEIAYRQRLHSGRLNREAQNALEFTRGWQGIHSGQNAAIETSIIEILKHLGYNDCEISAQDLDTLNQKSYKITFTEPAKTRDSYPHPFAVFGTEVYTKGLEVTYLGANRNYENVAQVLGEKTFDRGTICLMDYAMTLSERRSLARIMKTTTNLKNIVVLDKVMALYLTRFDDVNRGKKMLQTALPFARVQPYTTGGFVAPEMFIGRSEELDQIRDMAGPVFVYGGRQLGKSALLRQVKSIEHNPQEKCYAFFIDLKNLDSDATLKKIVYELQNAKLIGDIQTWEDFSFEMHKLLDGQLRGVDKPNKLILLLDESDTFLSVKESEHAIDILRELLVAFNGQFKFVIAGLHKVIRFEQNSSFGNLNHISVLPFRPSDAMELFVKPMSYLGFHIADDSLISAVFSRTNYYPGSIQYYCKMLVDAVAANYKTQHFDASKNPPYTLDDEYLKNVLGNREFQEEIDQKFQITLHLDDDNYYEILALTVAWIYYDHNRPVSADISEIRDVCLMCGIDKITRLSDAELLSLLDEMVALNLLRRVDGKFEFNRYAFWHMMGTESEVNEKLDLYGLKS